MNIEEMINLQRRFEENFFDAETMTMEDRQRWIEKFVVHIMDQSTSLLNELNWKEHRPTEPVDHDAVMRELVDIQKYVMAIQVVMNVDPDEFEQVFVDRSVEVEQRFEEEFDAR